MVCIQIDPLNSYMKPLPLATSLLLTGLGMALASCLNTRSLTHNKDSSKADSTVYYMYNTPDSDSENNIPELSFKGGFVADGYFGEDKR